jgi:PASTA domain
VRPHRKLAASANFLFRPIGDSLSGGATRKDRNLSLGIVITKQTTRCLLAAALAVGLGAGGAAAATTGTPQTITVISHAPATAGYDEAFFVAAGSSSNLPVSISSSGACSNSGGTFSMTSGTGTCFVKYDQAGDGTYDPAPQVIEQVAAHKADQEITFDALEDGTFGDPDFEVGAFASSNLDVTFSATGTCTITGVTVHLAGAGSCTVTAAQAGDGNYNPAPSVSQTFDIDKANQEITFDPLDNMAFGDPDFTVSASADSDLTVSFSAVGKCTVRGKRVHLTGPGSCTLTASQPGNANFNAAEDVSQSFSIAKPVCSVPRLTGKGLTAAKRALTQNRCRTGKVTYAFSRKTAKGRVISQSRRAGRSLPAGTKIDLVVSRGRP